MRRAALAEVLASVMGPGASGSGVEQSIGAGHAVAESIPRNVRILLAEDNASNQLVAMAMLKRLGYKADVAANGREALEALSRFSYDLVLMDCQMPEMDGLEATRRIRNSTSGALNPQTTIIAMTANVMQGDRELCLRAGMTDYLAKPVQLKDLAQMLERWLPSAEEAGGGQRAAPEKMASGGPSPRIRKRSSNPI